MKYNEDKILAEIQKYIESTYNQHYVGEDDDGIQTVDYWESLGSVTTTCRDMSVKYLGRFGKKDGYNRKDLLKAIHFIVLMMHFSDKKAKKVK